MAIRSPFQSVVGEDRRGQSRNGYASGVAVGGLTNDRVGGVLQDPVELQVEVLQRGVANGLRLVAAVEDDHELLMSAAQDHDDYAGYLVGADVEEAKVGLDLRFGAHAEERRAVTNAQHLAEVIVGALD